MKSSKALRPTSWLAILLGVAAFVATGAIALAADPQPAIQTSTPHSERQITNIDVLRQQIRNYYGDPFGTGTFAADGNYADEAEHVAKDGARWLKAKARPHRRHDTTMKAIVLDVDDTTLATWNYEVFSNWAYNPTTNADFVVNQRFPAVPGMVEMVNEAAAEGYAIFFLTGRPAIQEGPTLGNLTSDGIGVDAGYPHPTQLVNGEDGLFTKPARADYATVAPYLIAACAGDPNGGTCTTTHYKTATREHIESLGYEIVGNFGDQFSDLEGGFADRTFKLPNPNYFLP
jgi:predicted secreted acid phosphatase